MTTGSDRSRPAPKVHFLKAPDAKITPCKRVIKGTFPVTADLAAVTCDMCLHRMKSHQLRKKGVASWGVIERTLLPFPK
jgi:hypothetical protein